MCHIVLIAGLIVSAAVQQDSPRFTGLSATREKFQSSDIREKLKAVSQIQDLGALAAGMIPDLLKTLSTDDLALKHEIVIALGKMGPAAKAAVPKLISLLDEPSLILKHSSILALGKIGPDSKESIAKLTVFLEDKNAFLRIPAASALVRIDPENDSQKYKLITILADALGDPNEDLRSDAVYALATIGKPASAALTNRFLHSDPIKCLHVCDVLALIGPDADAAVPTLIKIVNRKQNQVCSHGLRALGAIGTRPEIVVPELKKFLSHQSASVRANATLALGKFGEAASSASIAIARNLSDSDDSVRLASIRTLGMIGAKAKDSIPSLINVLSDDTGTVTLAAAESLGRIGKPAVEPVSKLLNHPKLATLAASILGEIGSDAKVAVPELVKTLMTTNGNLKREVILALASIGPSAKASKSALIGITKSETGKNRSAAVYALSMIGEVREIVPFLEKSINDRDDELLRITSTWALLRFDPENKSYIAQTLPNLKAALKHESPIVRREVTSMISRLGSRAKATVPELMLLLEDHDPRIRSEAISALGEIGELSPDQIIEVAKNLNDPVPDVRTATCFTLGKMGVQSRNTVMALNSMLLRKDPFENFVVHWALLRINPTESTRLKAIPSMLRTLKESHSEARVEAIESLGLIGTSKPEVLKALQNATDDSNPIVQSTAKKILKKLAD